MINDIETGNLKHLIKSLEQVKEDVNMAMARLGAIITDEGSEYPMRQMYPSLCRLPISPSGIQLKLLQVRWDLADDIHRLEKGLKDDNS